MIFLGTNQCSNININVSAINIKATDVVKLLGINVDCKLNFNKHIENIHYLELEISSVLNKLNISYCHLI